MEECIDGQRTNKQEDAKPLVTSFCARSPPGPGLLPDLLLAQRDKQASNPQPATETNKQGEHACLLPVCTVV